VSFALGFLLGAASVFVAQYAYVRAHAARERKSLIDLRDDRAEVPGALILGILRHEKGRH
jgi:hypothetical protein